MRNNYKTISYRYVRKSAARVLAKTFKRQVDTATESKPAKVTALNMRRINQEKPEKKNNCGQVGFDDALRKYSVLYEFAPMGYFTLDEEGSIIEINTAGADLLGVDRADLLHSSFSRFVAPEFKDAFYFHHKRVLAGIARQKCELKLMRRDGASIFVRLESIAGKDEGGNLTRLLSAMNDITESRMKAEELQRVARDLRERTRELHCLYTMSIIADDKDRSLEEIVERVVGLIPPALQYADIACARIMLNGRVYQSDNFRETVWKLSSEIYLHQDQIGTLEVFYLEEKPMAGEGPFLMEEKSLVGKIARGLGYIVERKKLEESLKQSNADLERKVEMRTTELKRSNQQLQLEMEERNRITEELRGALEGLRENRAKLVRCERLSALGEVAAKITHEIRNPIVTIGGFARRMLKADNAGEINKNYLTIIVEEIKRLESVLTDILFFAKPADPTCRIAALNSVVKNSLKTLRFELEENNISLTEHLDPHLPLICLDENQIRRVLHNLIRNAIEAMPKGGSLSVSTGKNHEWEIVKIADSGTGIAQSDLNRMFDAFYTSKVTGSGLGLTISAQIINSHGGTIEAFNRKPKGTVFIIKLPLTRPVNQGNQIDKAAHHPETPDAQQPAR